MNRNEQTMDRIERMAENLRAAGVAATIEQLGGTTFLEWTRERNGYPVEEGNLHIYKNDRTGNLRFMGGSVRHHGTVRQIKTWNDANRAVSSAREDAIYAAQEVTA